MTAAGHTEDSDKAAFLVRKNDIDRASSSFNPSDRCPEFNHHPISFATEFVHVLQHRPSDGHPYVRYEGSDKRLDQWIPGPELRRVEPPSDALPSGANNGKRKRETSTSRPVSPTNSTRASSFGATRLPDAKTITALQDTMTEDDFDVQHYKQNAAQRNFDKVNFGRWQIKTWYVAVSSGVEDNRPMFLAGTFHRIH